jgi:hypothetical protein
MTAPPSSRRAIIAPGTGGPVAFEDFQIVAVRFDVGGLCASCTSSSNRSM